MQGFEEYAQQVTDGLDLSDAMKQRIRQEVVTHLEDEMQRCLSEGLTQDKAYDAALERFGNEQTIRRLVAQALELKEVRFRRLCIVSGIIFAAALVLVAIGTGAWLTVFKDAVAGRDFRNSMPRLAWQVMYLGAGIGCLAILAMVIAKLFRVGRLLTGLCLIASVVIFYASMFLFQSIPFLRETIGTIRTGQSARTLIVHSFLMRLYLCWVPTIIVGVIISLLAKRRACILWLSVSFAVGLISAVLWGFTNLPRPAPWMYWMKWPKLLSTGLLALLFVMLTGFLARSVTERFGWGDSRRTNNLDSKKFSCAC
jgi:hypothetical protein